MRTFTLHETGVIDARAFEAADVRSVVVDVRPELVRRTREGAP